MSNKGNFEIGLADSKPVHGEKDGEVDTEGDASSKNEEEPEVELNRLQPSRSQSSSDKTWQSLTLAWVETILYYE